MVPSRVILPKKETPSKFFHACIKKAGANKLDFMKKAPLNILFTGLSRIDKDI
jgi:hypothetical protein